MMISVRFFPSGRETLPFLYLFFTENRFPPVSGGDVLRPSGPPAGMARSGAERAMLCQSTINAEHAGTGIKREITITIEILVQNTTLVDPRRLLFSCPLRVPRREQGQDYHGGMGHPENSERVIEE